MAGALCAGTWRREAHDEPAPPDERGGVTAGHRPGPRSSETAQKELQATAWFGANEDGVEGTVEGLGPCVFPTGPRAGVRPEGAGRAGRWPCDAGRFARTLDLTDRLAGPCPRSRSSPRGRDRERPTTIPIRRHHGQRTRIAMEHNACSSSFQRSDRPSMGDSNGSSVSGSAARIRSAVGAASVPMLPRKPIQGA